MEGFKVENFNRSFVVERNFLCKGDEEKGEEEEQIDTATFFEDRNTMSEFNNSLAKTGAVYIDTETERCA
jgi:hypothetical protein